MERRAAYLVGKNDKNQYDGVFFDWGSGHYFYDNEYPPIYDTFYDRHSGLSYQQIVANFYATLHEAAPNLVIESNRGFREAE